jgi:hypothetical protein
MHWEIVTTSPTETTERLITHRGWLVKTVTFEGSVALVYIDDPCHYWDLI